MLPCLNLVILKLQITDFKLIRLLRKFICRDLYALVTNAVNLN